MNPSMFPQAVPLDYPKIKNIGIATMLDRLYIHRSDIRWLHFRLFFMNCKQEHVSIYKYLLYYL